MPKPTRKQMVMSVKDKALGALKRAAVGGPLSQGEQNAIRNQLIGVLADDVPKALRKGMTVEQKIEKLKNDKLFMRFVRSAGVKDEEIDGWVKGAADDYYTRKDRTEMVEKTRKVGRNEPCPCGSGRKYKKCCGG